MANVINISENYVTFQDLKLNEISWELFIENVETVTDNDNEIIKSIKYFEAGDEVKTKPLDFKYRFKLIVEHLKTDHLNKEELKALCDLCYEYSDIFFIEGDKIVGTDLVTHKIITPINHPPINTRQYRLD